MHFDLANVLWRTPKMLTPVRASFDTEFEEEIGVMVEEQLAPRVVLFNDDYHTFDEVIDQVCKATGCGDERAESIAWEVHTSGKAVVYEGDVFDCLRVSSILEEIALHTQVVT